MNYQPTKDPITAHVPTSTGAGDSVLKRGLDLIGSAFLLVFLAPLFLAIALVVRLDSPGPILFVQRRTGMNGRLIRVIKFRTMTVTEDGPQVRHAEPDDRRITRAGGFLRRASFDELPQLVNVLRGEMSLVGPRPHALAHDHYYGTRLPTYALRFRARPGITGLAQVSGHRGAICSVEGMAARVAVDNRYIDRWSFWLDLQILLKTLFVGPFQGGAF